MSANAPTSPGTSWTVTGVSQFQQIAPDGHQVDVFDISFTVDDGAGAGSVQVDSNDITAADVSAAIQRRADEIAMLLALSG